MATHVTYKNIVMNEVRCLHKSTFSNLHLPNVEAFYAKTSIKMQNVIDMSQKILATTLSS